MTIVNVRGGLMKIKIHSGLWWSTYTKIATISEDMTVQESFQALKDYVDSVLEGQVSRCQLIYEP